MKTENKRHGRSRILFGGLLALALLLAVCLWWHGRQIPADIASRIGQVLAAAGFGSDYVQAVNGRVKFRSAMPSSATGKKIFKTCNGKVKLKSPG